MAETTYGAQSSRSESTMTPVVNWILRLIPALIIGRAAAMKFLGNAAPIAIFDALEMEPGGRYLIATIEALTVVMLLSPRISAWGALLGLGVMTGAVIAHSTVIGFTGNLGPLFAMAIVTTTCCIALIYRLRQQIPFVKNMFDQ